MSLNSLEFFSNSLDFQMCTNVQMLSKKWADDLLCETGFTVSPVHVKILCFQAIHCKLADVEPVNKEHGWSVEVRMSCGLWR